MEPRPEADVMVCPPATLLAQARVFPCQEATSCSAPRIATLDSQDAHTGDISAEMLADAGAKAVIVGHSERRTDHGETDALVTPRRSGRPSGRA